MKHTVTVGFGGRPLTLETGRIARQASGAVLVTYGDTVVLVTAVAMPEARSDLDFLPLTVNYQEKFYAAGKIPGSFFRREGRPTDRETLTCRMIDRPIRPLFPDGWTFDTQIMATVLSVDNMNDSTVAAMVGASAALMVSDIPFQGPLSGIRLGRVDGKLIVNPSVEELDVSDLDLAMAASKKAIVMVEAGAQEFSEEQMLEALSFGHQQVQGVLDAQIELASKVGPTKRNPSKKESVLTEDDKRKFLAAVESGLSEALSIKEKLPRYTRFSEVKEAGRAAFSDEERAVKGKALGTYFSELKGQRMRETILSEKRRIDSRDLTTVRPIDIEVGLLPRVHGSALFTRGETQAVVAATLGTSQDEQKLDLLEGFSFKKFMLHYNFPPFSVGETSFRLAPGRREIGHGALAERAIKAVLPDPEQFVYTIRVVSDITESNGSSSMATVCGASLALMDAGVPVRGAVAGVAMGLIKDGERVAILTDILGDEDHLGDMDFKVAGTEEGITALQMDIKIEGVTAEIMKQALAQARQGRLHILGEMAAAIAVPRDDISPYAPRITTIQIPVERIRDVIGPGGKVIKEIIAKTGCSIDIEDDGRINIASSDPARTEEAMEIIRQLTREAEVGMVYKGKVKRLMDFGAFVEILPGLEGLLHISQLDFHRVREVSDVLKEGDEVLVKCIEVDTKANRIRLSRKEVLYMDPAEVPFQSPTLPPDPPEEFVQQLHEDAERQASSAGGRGGDRDRDRGGRGGDRGGDRDRGGRGGGRDRDRGGRGGGDRGGRR